MTIDAPPLFIRADGSASLGIAHIVRMMALAETWPRKGECQVVSAVNPKAAWWLDAMVPRGTRHVARPQAKTMPNGSTA